jgi:hypothetical protein
LRKKKERVHDDGDNDNCGGPEQLQQRHHSPSTTTKKKKKSNHNIIHDVFVRFPTSCSKQMSRHSGGGGSNSWSGGPASSDRRCTFRFGIGIDSDVVIGIILRI